jgi:anti-sigma-K factor RskA
MMRRGQYLVAEGSWKADFLPATPECGYHWIVTLDSNGCPAGIEDVAEEYVVGTLSEEQAVAFEDHYAACDTCATVLYKTADYVDAMRAAAKKLRAEPSRAASTSSPN